MQRKQLADGVFLCTVKAERFKTARITVNFIMPSCRKTATCAALLPLLLERCCAAWPDMTAFSRKLAQLYGASLSADTTVQGTARVLSVNITGIRDEYALNHENLSAEYAKVLFETVFAPNFVNGVFEQDAVKIEKQKLAEVLQTEINDKRVYCVRQAKRSFFGDAPAGVEKNGYLDELDAITPQTLTDYYHEMIRTARIELMSIGGHGADVAALLQERLRQVRRAPAALLPFEAMPVCETMEKQESLDTVQGKVCLLFTAGRILSEEEYAAMRLGAAVFGSLPTSRLFTNVREKQSLCYYCAAVFSQVNGMLSVDSGVEHQNAVKTKNAVLHELAELQEHGPTKKELADAKRALGSALDGVEDSLAGIEMWYLGCILRGHIAAPAEVAAALMPVSAEQVRQVLRLLRLSVVYTITKGGAQNEA